MTESLIVLYAVRNREGKWFRALGWNGGYDKPSGKSWVDDLKSAKIYTRPGQAKSRATFFARTWPEFGVPEVVELHVTHTVTIDQSDRVAMVFAKEKARKSKAKAKSQTHITD